MPKRPDFGGSVMPSGLGCKWASLAAAAAVAAAAGAAGVGRFGAGAAAAYQRE